jgi:hypothetical protein
MFPWFFFWTPQVHWPLSGAVKQHISQDTLFDSIEPTAGDGTLEKAIFNVSSYGTQIGTLSDVVMYLWYRTMNFPPDENAPSAADAERAVRQLRETREAVSALKKIYRQSRVETISLILDKLKEHELQEVREAVERRSKKVGANRPA